MSAKRQTQAERVLEKTVLQCETVAAGIKAEEAREAAASGVPKEYETEDDFSGGDRDPYSANPANEEKFSVICPDCGQLVPSVYDSFPSKDEADAYAREHCDCHKSGNGITETDVPMVMVGTCRFCGQARNVDGCRSQEAADEQATMICKCAVSQKYRDKIEAEKRRAEALREVADNLQALFADVPPELMQIMRIAGTEIYDRKLVTISLRLSYTVSAKISRNSKGNIAIERKDASAQKVEV